MSGLSTLLSGFRSVTAFVGPSVTQLSHSVTYRYPGDTLLLSCRQIAAWELAPVPR